MRNYLIYIVLCVIHGVGVVGVAGVGYSVVGVGVS